MDRYDLLEAMSGIRDEYIEEAAIPNQAGQAEDKTAGKEQAEAAIKTSKRAKILHMQRWAAAAAAVLLCLGVFAVTNRSGSAADDSASGRAGRQGFVTMSEEAVNVEEADSADGAYEESFAAAEEAEEADEAYEESPAQAEEAKDAEKAEQSLAAADSAGGQAGNAEADAVTEAQKEGTAGAADAFAEAEGENNVSALVAMTTAGITGTVKDLAEEEVRLFEDSLALETGYRTLRFTHEVTTDSDQWFSLRMLAYTDPSDGFEQVTHFNISREKGEYVTLETLFGEDTDYITPLSEEVIRQMREQMAENPEVEFWLDSAEGSAYDFRQISPAQDFYFDQDGKLVLCFNEGEAAPMYMGTVEFTIPDEVTLPLLENGTSDL